MFENKTKTGEINVCGEKRKKIWRRIHGMREYVLEHYEASDADEETGTSQAQ